MFYVSFMSICAKYFFLRAKKTRNSPSLPQAEQDSCSISVTSIVNMRMEKSKKSCFYFPEVRHMFKNPNSHCIFSIFARKVIRLSVSISSKRMI